MKTTEQVIEDCKSLKKGDDIFVCYTWDDNIFFFTKKVTVHSIGKFYTILDRETGELFDCESWIFFKTKEEADDECRWLNNHIIKKTKEEAEADGILF